MAQGMYRCQMCSQLVSAGIPAKRIVVETRVKKYPYRMRANTGFERKKVFRKDQNGKDEVVYLKRRSRKPQHRIDDPGGQGFEIVRELTVCPDCAIRSS